MSEPARTHPERLLWYAGGSAEPEDVAEIERHLATCPDCREELSTLRSLIGSLRAGAGAGHVSVVDLVAYHDGDPAMSAADSAQVGKHVVSCASCREDLESLAVAAAYGRTGAREHATLVRFPAPIEADSVRTRSGFGRWFLPLFAAAAAVLVVLVMVPPKVAVSHATLRPPLRGPDAATRLSGLGPWELAVWLPTRGPADVYRARIRGDDAREVPLTPSGARMVPDNPSVFRVPGFPKVGRYVLELHRGGEASGETYAYPFDVTASP